MVKWVEYYVQDKYEKQGYDVIHNGAPDLILLKDGKIEFVEVKMSNNRHLSEDQKRAMKLLKKHGFAARVETVPKIPVHKKFIGEEERLRILAQCSRGELDPRDIYYLILRAQQHPTLKDFTYLLIALFNQRNSELDEEESDLIDTC